MNIHLRKFSYLLGEYIQVTPNGIKWRGEYYKKQQ